MSYQPTGKAIPKKKDIKTFELAILDYLAARNGNVREPRAVIFDFAIRHADFIIAALKKEMMHHDITEVGVPKGLEEIAKDLQMKRWRVYDR